MAEERGTCVSGKIPSRRGGGGKNVGALVILPPPPGKRLTKRLIWPSCEDCWLLDHSFILACPLDHKVDSKSE